MVANRMADKALVQGKRKSKSLENLAKMIQITMLTLMLTMMMRTRAAALKMNMRVISSTMEKTKQMMESIRKRRVVMGSHHHERKRSTIQNLT